MGVDVVKFQNQCLNEHNRLRALHGCPPLRLSIGLCDYAQEWAKYLGSNKKFENRKDPIYGENIFMSKGGRIDGKKPVNKWYSEIKGYSFEKSDFTMNTRQFTQVIWKGSQEMGVGIYEKGDVRFIVANYKPPGNYLNELKANVPKKKEPNRQL